MGAAASAGRTTGPGTRLRDLRVYRGRAFHCFLGLAPSGNWEVTGTSRIMERGRSLHFPRRRSERGTREKVGADAPRPPSCSLPVNAPERKVTGPLDVSWAGIFLVFCGMGEVMGIVTHGYRRGPF